MELDIQQIKSITNGAVKISELEDGFHFYRFSEEQIELYKQRNADLYKMTFATSGVEFRFLTNSETMSIVTSVTAGSTRTYFAFDIYVNRKKIGVLSNFNDIDVLENYTNLDFPHGEFSKRFDLGSGEKEVRVVFPWSVTAVIKSLTLDDNCTVMPITPSKKILCFGDSITQGYDARYPSNKYVTQFSDFLNAEEFNKAIGGEVFFPQLAQTRESFNPDYVLVAYGTNDWSKIKKDNMTENCTKFYKNICKNYPNATIFALTPIWRKDYQQEKELGKFEDVAKTIRKATELFDNVIYISAFDFVPKKQTYFADLRLHPNDEGFGEYYSNLVRYFDNKNI